MEFYHIQDTGRETVHSDHAQKTLDDEDRVCSQEGGPGRELVPESCLTRVCGCSGQRHFCVFAVSFPGQEALATIYNTILSQHLAFRSVPMVVQRMSNQLVASALGKLAISSPVIKTHCFMGLMASSDFPLVNILFILLNQYF